MSDATPVIPQVRPPINAHDAEAVATVVRSGWVTEGGAARAFVHELNTLVGTPFGVLAPNGTLALAMALIALGVGAGDEVLVPNITFISSANAILIAGATPVFVDIRSDTLQIDVVDADAKVTPRTRAIMAVHLYGSACDMAGVMALSGRRGLLVVEDAAQAIGVAWHGRHVGAIGDAGCFSFFADKTITTGEGGYVACRDPAVHERLRYLRNHGRLDSGSFLHPRLGANLRMTDMQAALGLAQLRRLDDIIAAKRRNQAAYEARLAGVRGLAFLEPTPGSSHTPFRTVILARDAQGLMRHLAADRIEPRGVFHPLNRQPCYAELAAESGRDRTFPRSEQAFATGVCLPVYPDLTSAEIDAVCRSVREFVLGTL